MDKDLESAILKEEKEGTDKMMAGCLWWFVIIWVALGITTVVLFAALAAAAWRWVLS